MTKNNMINEPGPFALSGANADITSMTGLTGYLAAPLGFKDASGNILFQSSYVASAVNYLLMQNAATGGAPAISATGSDSAVPFIFFAKNSEFIFQDSTSTLGATLRLFNAAGTFYTGLGVAANQPASVDFIIPGADGSANFILKTNGSGTLTFTNGSQVAGTATNDSASAGNIGQVISSVIPSASVVTFSANSAHDLTSISLTAGDWDVWGNINYPSLATAPTAIYAWISTSSATFPDASLAVGVNLATGTLAAYSGLNAPYQRMSLSGTTTVYLSGQNGATSGNATACGGIYARRAR